MCHSFITYPHLRETEHNSPSTYFECVVNKTISFDHAVTLTGIKLDFVKETKAELEMECINYKTFTTITVKRRHFSAHISEIFSLFQKYWRKINGSVVINLFSIQRIKDHRNNAEKSIKSVSNTFFIDFRQNQWWPNHQQFYGLTKNIFVMRLTWNRHFVKLSPLSAAIQVNIALLYEKFKFFLNAFPQGVIVDRCYKEGELCKQYGYSTTIACWHNMASPWWWHELHAQTRNSKFVCCNREKMQMGNKFLTWFL